MASLTHVCMWTNDRWQPISAAEAAALHPGGKVSAQGGLFMCELCGQYVTLTQGNKRVRYFKHSRGEKDKNCPERTFGPGYTVSYNPQRHDLPIRIRINIASLATPFYFELGLIRAPISELGDNFAVEIRGDDDGTAPPRVFARERLNADRITYLPLGSLPCAKYTLTLKNAGAGLHKFWPAEIPGMDPDGTLFDAQSGRKLTTDADVEINKDYYLLTCRSPAVKYSSGITITEKTRAYIRRTAWTLYTIRAAAFNQEAARFFLDLHCRLTASPVSMHTIWPLCTEGSYLLKYNPAKNKQDDLCLLVRGNAPLVKVFPQTAVRPLTPAGTALQLYQINCAGRQQLISAGRSNALQYTYVWKDELEQTAPLPAVTICDLKGTVIADGEMPGPPYQKRLRFKSEFDGEILIFSERGLIEKRKLPAGREIELDDITYGRTIAVRIGLDVVRKISLQKKSAAPAADDQRILQQLTAVPCDPIPVPHALHNMLRTLQDLPLTSGWIRRCIRSGSINARAWRILQQTCRSMDKKIGEAS